MEENNKKLFSSLPTLTPPGDLKSRILLRVRGEEMALKRKRVLAFGGSTVFSLGLLSWATVFLIENIKETGFGHYFSLLFSENGVVFSYWRELSLSLVESLPVVGLIAVLASVGLFIWSLNGALKQNYGIRTV